MRHRFFLTASFLAALTCAQVSQAQLFSISERQELDAGRQADTQVQGKYRISRDSEANGMVRHLGSRLVSVCERPNLPWTFRVIESRDINAFSVPGYVYVNSGLLD